MRLQRSILYVSMFVAAAAYGVEVKPTSAQSHVPASHARGTDLIPGTGPAGNLPQRDDPEICAKWMTAPFDPKIVVHQAKTANHDNFGGWMHWMSSLSGRGFDPRAWQPGKGFNPFNPATWFSSWSSFRPAAPATAIQAGTTGGTGIRP
jgi:hypothetical protein